jgi:O-acetyl-ADP-ribose deacetylase (regulator of RNase III)
MALNPTPDFITQLKENEIFVFGSNLHGMHGGGAARTSHQQFGAEWGVGVGPTGKCYAIPTMHGGIDTIKPYVDDFITYAKEHTNQHFYVTRIGCGIAGFTDEQMAPLFKDLQELDNVSIPKQWADILGV